MGFTAGAFVNYDAYKEAAEATWGDGFADADMGDVEGPGHFIKITHDALHVHYAHQPEGEYDEVVGVIVQTDNQGFKDYELFGRESDLDSQWDQYEEAVADWDSQEDEDTDGPVPPSYWCALHQAPHEMGQLTCEVTSGETFAGTD